MGLSLSDWLGQVPEMTKRQPARANLAMLDAKDREEAGAVVLQKVGDNVNWANRGRLVATSEGWSSRRGRACENTELQASEDR